MMWLNLVMSGISTVVSQWIGAGEAERAAIEARALEAIQDMLSGRAATAQAHEDRTAATQAAIDRARGA